MPMRVALDTNPLYVTRAGVARYVRGLMRGLDELRAPDCQWQPLAWERENFAYAQPARAAKTIYRELIWARWQAPRSLRAARTDVFHATSCFPISVPDPTRNVVTLYDLALLRFPERFRRWQRAAGLRWLRQLHAADRILTISQFTADEAMTLLGLRAAKLVPVLLAADDVTTVAESPGELPPALPGEFFLFVGSLEPGKNLALLRDVWAQAATAGRRLPPLVIVGARWAGVPGEGGPPPDWHYLGHVSDAALVALYRRALALVFPSKYEGFGLPVLEAMALGCPVICSRVASLPEVGGEAAWWCDLSVAGYLDALDECASNAANRNAHIQAGTVQARKFSWRSCAAGTVDVYRAALRR